ncbi:SPOC like C-terminal domain-containing protein [Vararia minispora EC-137]|uniref:SPOC like C-terminal domain-containing protein n=1 Tax=Vararia minispora EC-137 TaxID=1314806 RepID=A0ACB8QUP2_9AGAM|nr:SPOC like C-terminal domain-containing protein [Vararia minispora EC-137]
MPAERAGYTVTMFLVDVSPSMGTMSSVDVPDGPDGEPRSVHMSRLERALQFVKLKIQEMIFNGRKTDQCGVLLFGTDDTNNIVYNKEPETASQHVTEYIPIGTPNAKTLAMIDEIKPSTTIGDPVNALVVGIETQNVYLKTKKTWTRRIVLLTDGENPLEIDDYVWKSAAHMIDKNAVYLTIVGVDFDDDEIDFHEEDKSHVKRTNESFFHTLISSLENAPSPAILGTLALALQELSRPDIKQTKSLLLSTTLRIGNPDDAKETSVEIGVKTSKCTAVVRPKSWKKFGKRVPEDSDGKAEQGKAVWAELHPRADWVIDKSEPREGDGDPADDPDAMDVDEEQKPRADKGKDKAQDIQVVEKENLIRGFRYGATHVPCPDGQFPGLETKKGIEICAFIRQSKWRRDWAMGEVQYVWADPDRPNAQVALSSLVRAMLAPDTEAELTTKGKSRQDPLMAIVRWVHRDGADPRIGVLAPCAFDAVDCLLFVPAPFADDVRRYTFSPLMHLVNRKGEHIKTHPFLPTDKQMAAMDDFVDAMDLEGMGEEDEDGARTSWFEPQLSYNPAIHRIKQALFHAAVVPDLRTHPLPPPHPELTKYFDPPRAVRKRARGTVDACVRAFVIKEVPKRVARSRKDDHVRAKDDEDEPLLIDRFGPAKPRVPQNAEAGPGPSTASARAKAAQNARGVPVSVKVEVTSPKRPPPPPAKNDDDSSVTEPESDDEPAPPPPKRPPPPPAKNDDDSSVTEPESDDEPAPPPPKRAKPAPAPPSPPRSPLPASATAVRRIVGIDSPLKDFRRNVQSGDLVSKAVEDLAWALCEIVRRPFASRRAGEVLEAMGELRDFCAQEDEVGAWNRFLHDLKRACLREDPGNRPFWTTLGKNRRRLGLIGVDEADTLGVSSEYSAEDVQKFYDEK